MTSIGVSSALSQLVDKGIFTLFELERPRKSEDVALLDVLGEEMLGTEEWIGLVDRSGAGLDAAVPRFEVLPANPTLHLDAEVPVGAEAPLGKHNVLHLDRTRKLDHLIVIKGAFQPRSQPVDQHFTTGHQGLVFMETHIFI